MTNGDVFSKMSAALSTNLTRIAEIQNQLHHYSYKDLEEILTGIHGSLNESLRIFRVREYEIERTLEKWLHLKNDLKLARQVQTTIFPHENVYLSNFQLAGYTRAAFSLGGDYYTYNISNSGLNAAIGDVSGKGIANALITIMMDNYYKNLLFEDMSPKSLLIMLNQFFNEIISSYNGLEKKFMTFLTMRYIDNRVEYAGAGHEYILIYRSDRQKCERIKTGGVALGLVSEFFSRFSEGVIELGPGDVLVTYSDGITEARNETLNLYGQKRLVDQIIQYHSLDPAEMINTIITDIDGFQGEHEQYDDITMLVMKRPA